LLPIWQMLKIRTWTFLNPAGNASHEVCACDVSVVPSAPRANLNIPAIMIAEKFADAIFGDQPK
jgi:hypothetical protein